MEYRREVDGLRALAVIPVILFHAGFQAFSGGFVGVDVFFVISGYLITSIILAEKKAGSFTLIGFYERRARRILPALLFVLLVCLPLAWMWLLPDEMRLFSASLVSVSTFSSNLFFYLTSGYFDGEIKPLLHTWSLAVEEQYYILFPVFIMLAWTYGKRWILFLLSVLALLSLAAAQWSSVINPEFGFLLLPTRAWELLIGVFIAFYLAEDNRKVESELGSVLGILLITYSVLAFDRHTPFPSLYALLPTIGTGLVILFATRETQVGRLLGSKPLVGVGLISYSAYLWHQPLFAFARHRSIDTPGLLLQSALAAAAIVLAYFSWKYVETPFRDRKRFSRQQVFLYGALFSGAYIAFGLVGYLNNGFESRVSEEVLSVHIGLEHRKQMSAAGCKLHAQGFRVTECIKGDVAVLPRYALIGDSHAQALTFELAAAFQRRHLSFIPYVRSACSLNFYMPPHIGDGDYRECVSYQNGVEKEVGRNGVETYVIFSRQDQHLEEQAARHRVAFAGHLKSVERLLDLGKTVVLVYPIPVHKVLVPDYMAKNIWFYGNQRDMVAEDKAAFDERIKYYRDGYDALGVRPNLVRIDASALLCGTGATGRCVTEINGVPLYSDESHLSNAGSRLLVEKIMQAIGSGSGNGRSTKQPVSSATGSVTARSE